MKKFYSSAEDSQEWVGRGAEVTTISTTNQLTTLLPVGCCLLPRPKGVRLSKKSRLGLSILAISMITPTSILVAQNLSIRSQRALEIGRLHGKVTTYQGKQKRPAQIGDRLQAQGEGILTQSSSYSTLLIDSHIGRVNIAENTDLRVKNLEITANGGRVTVLSVLKGHTKLLIRRFNNPESSLQVETPAGVAGVRGTEFGVGVGPNGKTNVATLEGTVTASAQGETVLVESGFGSVIVPGEAPSPPQKLTNDVSLKVRLLRTTFGTLEVSGQVDPLNLVWLDGQPVEIGKDGKFKTTIPLPLSHRLKIRVQSPLGAERFYPLLVP